MAHDDRYADAATATERIDRDLVLPAPPEEVWAVITTDGWLAERVSLELTPGGDALFTDGASVRTGWVEEACPPSAGEDGALVYWWGAEGEPATRVSLTLERDGRDLTRLRVTETRPLEVLHLVGVALPGQILPGPGQGGGSRGPALLAAA